MHEYVTGVPDCLCDDADDHAPCLECGSAKGAYGHVGDSAVSVAEITDDDGATTDESL